MVRTIAGPVCVGLGLEDVGHVMDVVDDDVVEVVDSFEVVSLDKDTLDDDLLDV